MRNNSIETFFALMFINLISFCLNGQCDAQLTPASNNPKAYRSIDNRREGFIQVPVSAYSIKFVSFTLGPFRFKMDAKEKIELTSPNSNIIVHASSLLNNSFYVMNTCMEPKTNLIWPVKDCLLNTPITYQNLGLLASKNNTLKEPYIAIRAQGLIEKLEDDTPTVKILSSTRLEKVRWRVLGEKSWNDVKQFNFPARMGIEFPLNKKLKGELTIEVEGKIYKSNDEWLNLPVKLIIP